ncbi:MAG: hypothetical protein QHC90_03130 [Shinella sp.]|nr:hypothetical protein [Shinella sp.]
MPGGFDVVKDRLLRANDGELMRAAFYSLLAAAVVFLAIDVSEIREQARTTQAATPGQAEDLPALPPALTEGEPQDMPGELQTDMDALRTPIRFELQPGGILSAAGTIDLGAADRFRGELDQRGEYVKTVLLNSPGGSVDDALSISEEIRKRNLGTRVAAGSICASSCPIVFAGGVTREAASDAIIGVHQVFNGGKDAPTPEQAMATAQATTARVSRHLEAMGIAPGLWFRALETPPDRLYYLSDEERRELRLTTGTLSAEAG